MSLWAIIRECVGKDLTRVCLPVYFNEPLSALQKLAEDLEYCGLLDQARCSLVLVQHTFFSAAALCIALQRKIRKMRLKGTCAG